MDPYLPKSSETELQQQTKELLCYLWDNYLENTRASVTLMGVGDAYLGVKQLLISRSICIFSNANPSLLTLPADSKSRIPGIISFVAGNLRPVKSETDQYLSNWYKSNSQIYVSPDHACWSDEESARKVQRSRFGKVVKADIEVGRGENGVGKMLKRYEEEAGEWVLAKLQQWEALNLGQDPDETEDEDEDVKMDGKGTMIESMRKVVDIDDRGIRVSSGPDLEMVGSDEMPRRPQGLQQSIRVPAGAAPS